MSQTLDQLFRLWDMAWSKILKVLLSVEIEHGPAVPISNGKMCRFKKR